MQIPFLFSVEPTFIFIVTNHSQVLAYEYVFLCCKQFGLLFDDIKEVFRAEASNIVPVNASLQTEDKIISSLIQMNGGGHTVELLDLGHLFPGGQPDLDQKKSSTMLEKSGGKQSTAHIAGRGFAVVADEIRKLAENSSKSAVDIANIVKKVEDESRETIGVMKDGMKMLSDGGKVINTALDATEKISEGIVTISDSVNDLNAKTEVLNANGSDVRERIKSVVSSSEENKTAAQSVNFSIDGTVEALKKLENSSRRLSEVVNEM